MTKIYSDEIKLTVVKEYQEEKLGIRPLTKKYGIKSKSQVGRWIKLYERFGSTGACHLPVFVETNSLTTQQKL